MIGLVVVTDGREHLPHTLASFCENVAGVTGGRILVDDSGDPGYNATMRERFAWDAVICHPQRLGLAAAVRSGWAQATRFGWEYLFHLEDDWHFDAELDAGAWAAALARRPRWAQVVAKRGPVNREEFAAGGICECAPDEYHDAVLSDLGRFTTHKRIFSLNPCVVPRRVFSHGWPDGNEAGQTVSLVSHGYEFAFAGGKRSAPIIRHTGDRRALGWQL